MRPTKTIQGKCMHCEMPLEFAADAIGTTGTCPYCRKETELTLSVPEIDSGIPRRLVIWTVVTVVILLLGLVGAFIALNRARDLANRKQGPPAVERAR